jgi:hypothetical protein
MCDVYGEYSKVWDETIVRARKRYVCDECGLGIPVACRYVRVGSLYDGHWDTFRLHIECKRLGQVISFEYCGAHGRWLVGSMNEEIAEYEEERIPWDEDGNELGAVECVVDCHSGQALHGPGTLHAARDQIRARYASA